MESDWKRMLVNAKPSNEKIYDDKTSLGDARRVVDNNEYEGTRCPCCFQYVKKYKRSITYSMCLALIKLYKEHERVGWYEWINIHNLYIKKNRMRENYITSLKYWGFVERNKGSKKDGNPNSGFWRITRRGVNFVRKQTKAPKSLWVRSDHVYDVETDLMVDIVEASKNKFDYSILMYGMTQEEKEERYREEHEEDFNFDKGICLECDEVIDGNE